MMIIEVLIQKLKKCKKVLRANNKDQHMNQPNRK